MKKLYILVLTSLLAAFSVSAQNWSLVMPNDTLVYEKQDDNQLFTVWVDSIKINGTDTTYFFNRYSPGEVIQAPVSSPCDSTNNIYTEKNHKTKPHFFGGTMNVAGTKSIIDYLPGRFVIFGQEPVGASWVCDSTNMDTMTVINVDTTFLDVYQVIDSVKTLRFKNKDLFLSKNHGILSSFDLTDSVQTKLNNVGVQNLNLGITIPLAKEVFDFEVGDIFYREEGDGDSEQYKTTQKKIIILSKSLTADSVFYTAKVIAQISYFYPQTGNTEYWPKSETMETLSFPIHHTDGIESTLPHTIGFNQSSDSNFLPSVHFETFVFVNDQNIIEKRSGFNLSPNGYMANIVCVSDSFFYTTKDVKPSIACGEGLGYVYKNFWGYSGLYTGYEKLIGYQKVNGQTWGDSTFTSVSELDYSNLITIYPNPTNSQINITTQKLNGITVLEMYDLQGRLITTKNFESKLTFDVSQWSSGVYFAVIKDMDGTVLHREKIIIQ